MSRSHRFVTQLAEVQLPAVFNPYRDRCPFHDLANAHKVRRAILEACLFAAEDGGVDSLWVARDLGYRGGRRTGLALTDDIHLAQHGARWAVTAERATKGAPVAERTAATVWKLLQQIPDRVFLWNVFPLHPHTPGDPLSNRQHSREERDLGLDVLSDLIRLLRPRRVVAIGNDAVAAAVVVAGTAEVVAVRHPSYGGTRVFEAQVRACYKLATDASSARLI